MENLSAKMAIEKLLEMGVPSELMLPLINLLPYERVAEASHVGEALAFAWSSWAAKERREGRDPGALPQFPVSLAER